MNTESGRFLQIDSSLPITHNKSMSDSGAPEIRKQTDDPLLHEAKMLIKRDGLAGVPKAVSKKREAKDYHVPQDKKWFSVYSGMDYGKVLQPGLMNSYHETFYDLMDPTGLAIQEGKHLLEETPEEIRQRSAEMIFAQDGTYRLVEGTRKGPNLVLFRVGTNLYLGPATRDTIDSLEAANITPYEGDDWYFPMDNGELPLQKDPITPDVYIVHPEWQATLHSWEDPKDQQRKDKPLEELPEFPPSPREQLLSANYALGNMGKTNQEEHPMFNEDLAAERLDTLARNPNIDDPQYIKNALATILTIKAELPQIIQEARKILKQGIHQYNNNDLTLNKLPLTEKQKAVIIAALQADKNNHDEATSEYKRSAYVLKHLETL